MIKRKINWFGPYGIESENLEEYKGVMGLYMISKKRKNIDEIIYIGIAKNIYKRLIQHKNYWLDDEPGQLQIRIGIVKNITYKKLKDIESVLIFTHRPYENSVNKEDYWGQDIQILNEGRRGELFKEIKLLF